MNRIPITGVCNHEPWYKKLSQCETKGIVVTVSTDEDARIAKLKGVRALRHFRIKRLIQEANDQGVLLSFEQIANMLTASVKTISRDIKYILETEGIVLKTRKCNTQIPGGE